MSELLTPEELAEIGGEYDHRVDAYFRHNERPNCDTETIGKLLGHIESRELAFKEVLQVLKARFAYSDDAAISNAAHALNIALD